jgi:hypothetical protein
MHEHHCESCGMPIESGTYCQHCVDEHGKLQAFDERFERMVQWQLGQKPGTLAPKLSAKRSSIWQRCPPGAITRACRAAHSKECCGLAGNALIDRRGARERALSSSHSVLERRDERFDRHATRVGVVGVGSRWPIGLWRFRLRSCRLGRCRRQCCRCRRGLRRARRWRSRERDWRSELSRQRRSGWRRGACWWQRWAWRQRRARGKRWSWW